MYDLKEGEEIERETGTPRTDKVEGDLKYRTWGLEKM
jgi:hypothetical protein